MKLLVFQAVQTTAMSGFIVDNILDEEANEHGFDTVCAFCDNGGSIMCCVGGCGRSFHPTVEAGSESLCVSLGFSQEKVDELWNFICKNCEYKQHQCFACGKLGSSDKFSGAEVFPCASATCVYFYHPHCAAKLCCACKQGENKKDPQLQFAVCRRCPKSYHRKCLPREIAFEDIENEDIIPRAWEGLSPNRTLIYCLNHEIDEEIGTPIRDHIKFPGVMTPTDASPAPSISGEGETSSVCGEALKCRL
ncbi:hypothetical protein SLA2020_389580 [Shorea laevis]